MIHRAGRFSLGSGLGVALALLLTACGGGDGGGDGNDPPISDADKLANSSIHNIPFSAWVGENDTLYSLGDTAQGMTLTRSADPECDIGNYSLCAWSGRNTVTAAEMSDGLTTLERPAWYWLQGDGGTSRPLALSIYRFAPRTSHQSVVFNGKLWVMGGETPWGAASDVWSSYDGAAWTREYAPTFPHRSRHTITPFNGRLWMIGGIDGTQVQRDIWSSADGTNWTQERINTPFPARYSHQVVVHDGKLWLIGGRNGSQLLEDVWSSSDGRDWQLVNASPEFTPRLSHTVTSFGGRLWLIGGYDGQPRHDVWSSTDGVAWKLELATAPFSPIQGHNALSFNGRLWITGGFNTDESSVWSSGNGLEWTLHSEHKSAFLARELHQTVVFRNRLHVIGGNGFNCFIPATEDEVSSLRMVGAHCLNDVWSSSDGSNWREETFLGNFHGRSGFQALNFDGKLWLYGGRDGLRTYDDVWLSSDGIHWERRQSNDFPRRHGHRMASFKNALWLIGGSDGDMPTNDVYSSSDGFKWSKATTVSPFESREGHALMEFQDKLWLIGGLARVVIKVSGEPDKVGWTLKNDIWNSANGKDWTRVTPPVASDLFSARRNHQLAVIQNQLWLIGGEERVVTKVEGEPDRVEWRPKNDIWSSEDGVKWVLRDDIAPFPPLAEHQVTAYRGKLWLSGSHDPETGRNLIWNSSDGLDWSLVPNSTPFAARRGHQTVVFNNQLHVIGGRNGNLGLNDIWRSSDGVRWRLGYRQRFSAY